jgi:transketolase
MNDQNCINTIKGLVLDGVGRANSGHPGGAFSSVDFAYILFTEFLRFDPEDAKWQGRDRFVLSAGHESMLQYSLLHMVGWLPMTELMRFRQLHSKTPGHPEVHLTPGVECTTGPLGQGAAMSVGMAIAGSHLSSVFGQEIFGHRTYALLGDGCMQEDVTLGAASLAGHLRLGNMTWFYDRNRIQISGSISRSTSDNEAKIFEGFGWAVREIDGHDHAAIRDALNWAGANQSQPTLIIGNTTIAKGAFSVEGSHKTHGAPFSNEERARTKEKLGLDAKAEFQCSESALTHFRRHFSSKSQHVQQWKSALAVLRQSPDKDLKFRRYFDAQDFKKLPPIAWPKDKDIATRNAFGDILEKWADEIPNLVGGSADLEPSNMTEQFFKKVSDFQWNHRAGRNISFGVREFPMSAIANGIALHGGLIPFDATFLSFSDYARPALRLGAIQKIRVIHEYSHDSFYLGEDGPTHQAIEHVMSLRLIPDFYLMRPADAIETEFMMRAALQLEAPSAICLTRQKLPMLKLDRETVAGSMRGAYIVADCKDPEFLIIATGSEVSLALQAAQLMPDRNIRVVSMPCWELFSKQDSAYQESILPAGIQKRVSIEAGSTLGWQKFTGINGLNIGVDHFGDSAPAEELAELYGFTPKKLAARISEHKF